MNGSLTVIIYDLYPQSHRTVLGWILSIFMAKITCDYSSIRSSAEFAEGL